MTITVRLLEASYGDAILVSHSSGTQIFNLLIDGGPSKTFESGIRGRRAGPLRIALDELKEKGQFVDLVILTHIDSDHIRGLIRAFKSEGYLSSLTKQVWLNSSSNITAFLDKPEIPENIIPFSSGDDPETSVRDAKTFEGLLVELDCWRREIIVAGQRISIGPFEFTILSPSVENLRSLLCIWPDEDPSAYTSGEKNDYHQSFEELLANDSFVPDSSFANGSSIAFILKADGKRLMFLGDAYASTVVETLRSIGYSETNKVKVDCVKLSHHGSHFNTSVELLNLIDSEKYLISTDGTRHGHPHKRTLARVFNQFPGSTVYLNYQEALEGILLKSEVLHYESRLLSITGGIEI